MYTDSSHETPLHERTKRKNARDSLSKKEDLGFFAWRHAQFRFRHSNVLTAKAKRQRVTEDDEMAELPPYEVAALVPKPASFLRWSSTNPFPIFPGQEDPELVQEALHFATTSFWPFLSPSSATTPHPDQLYYGHMQMSKLAFYGYMIPVTAGLNYMVADHPHRKVHEKLRQRYTVLLLKEVRNILNDLPVDRFDELIAVVLIFAVCSQPVVTPRQLQPRSAFESPLAYAQLLDLFGALKYDSAHLAGLRRLVELRGGLDKMTSPDLAALVQV